MEGDFEGETQEKRARAQVVAESGRLTGRRRTNRTGRGEEGRTTTRDKESRLAQDWKTSARLGIEKFDELCEADETDLFKALLLGAVQVLVPLSWRTERTTDTETCTAKSMFSSWQKPEG